MAETFNIKEEPEVQWLKRLRVFILGKNKPPFLTRVFLLAGLVSFCYYFFWNLIRFTLLSAIDSDLKITDPELVKATMYKIGSQYDIADPQKTFLLYAIVMMAVYAVMLFSMILIYRRKIIGYYLFFLTQIAAILTPFLTLGWEYSTDEVDLIDYGAPLILIGVFYYSLGRLKRHRQKEREEAKGNTLI